MHDEHEPLDPVVEPDTATDDGRTPESAPPSLLRRDALKVLAASAGLPILASIPLAEAEPQQTRPATGTPPATPATAQARPVSGPRGDAWDPDLIRPKKDWPRKLTASEMATLAALADVIIPADAKSPSASAVGAHLYINEYVSAPGDAFERDLIRVRGGVSWLNLESQKRFQKRFTALTLAQKTAICDDICFVGKATEEFKSGAQFFSLIRNLVATAFYTTDAGMKDVGYVGNVALPKWEPPPAAVLRQLGLE